MIAQFYKQFQHWGAQGTVWIYSDPHFGDEELRAGVRGRPDDEAAPDRMHLPEAFSAVSEESDPPICILLRSAQHLFPAGAPDDLCRQQADLPYWAALPSSEAGPDIPPHNP